MKKFVKVMAVCMTVAALFAGCGDGEKADATDQQATTQQTEAVPDLNGEWKQTNGDENNYQSATIANGTIEIYWVDEEDDSKSLYWAGTYVAPTDASDPYTWDSENDHDKTDSSLLASGDDTKTFTYSDGVLSYEASALGTTKTIKMERAK